jgi:hypothetical protein
MPSSVINHYHYDDKSHTLIITFVTGMVYKYLGVPERVYKLFKASISKGKYFNYHIKDKFEFEKIDD